MRDSMSQWSPATAAAFRQMMSIPAGGTRKYLITCEGKPFASFDDRAGAEAAMAMYSKNLSRPDSPSNNARMKWAITIR